MGSFRASDGRQRSPLVQARHFAGRASLHSHRAPAWPSTSMAHPGRRRDARRRTLGSRLADFRCAQVSKHGHYARRHRGNRNHWAGAGKARFPENRELHGGALGHDHVMTEEQQRRHSVVRGALAILAAAAIYEAMARSGYFAPALLPTLPTVARTLFASIADGSMIEHAAFTLYRVMFGFALSVVVGLPLGILMARFQSVQNFFLPLVSAMMQIPSFALVPLFMLWFGIGNLTTI